MPDTRILVTGATGFVGLWTLRRLRDARPDAEVWATSDRPDPGDLPAARYRQLDLRDETAVRELVRDCRPTGVVHLASLIAGADLEAYLSVNVLGTGRLYDALAAEAPDDLRIVQVGSAAMYGAIRNDELPVREEQPLRPLTPYAVSKVAQEYLATSAGLSQGLAIVRARIFNLLGPGQPAGLVPMTFVPGRRRTSAWGSSRPAAISSTSATRSGRSIFSSRAERQVWRTMWHREATSRCRRSSTSSWHSRGSRSRSRSRPRV